MVKKYKKRQGVSEVKEDYEISDNRIKISIIALIIFVLGLISLLSLFSLSGRFGSFLDNILSLGFGWGRFVFPAFLIIFSIALYKGKKFFSKSANYIGLSLFFIFTVSLLHFFFKTSIAEYKATIGLGGGYLGYYLSLFFQNIFGFWGGLVIILAILVVAVILLFNITLSDLVGSKSILYRAIYAVINFFKDDDDKNKSDEDLGEEEYEEYDEILIKEVDKKNDQVRLEPNVNREQGILFSKKNIGEENINDYNDKKDSIKEINWKTKKIKIDLPLELLSDKVDKATSGDINNNILIIQRTLENFGISVEMGEVNVGPTVTQYTFKPSEGIKVSRITALSNDLSLALAAHPIRIEAPIPGKSLIGIEVPNRTKATVGLRESLESKDFKLRQSNLMVALGKDVSGRSIVYDIAKMPHLLVAGATNSGKSVCLNTIIVSLLYQNNPDALRFIMVDPKRVEFPVYNGIPHLLTPVITDVNKTVNALRWCLNEMDRRYEILNQAGKKNIQTYNQSSGKDKMPYIIFIIDELADLMVAASKDIEGSVIRLTQMSRAVGIHLILATQRPSVDVITGLIKANTPARIAFSVASAIDSKTILDSSGAEKLLGRGDMLFSTAELSKPRRIQGAFVTDDEILNIVNYIKEKYGTTEYLEGVVERQKVNGGSGIGLDGIKGDEDELMDEAKEIIVAAGKASTSLLQRRLRIGYSRAASILDMLEESGIIGPSNGSKPREILISREQYENSLATPMASQPVHDRLNSKAPDNYLYSEDETPLVFDDTINSDEDELETEIEVKSDKNDQPKNKAEKHKEIEEVESDDDFLEEESEEIEEDEEITETDNEKNIDNKKNNKEKVADKKNEIDDDDFAKYFSK